MGEAGIVDQYIQRMDMGKQLCHILIVTHVTETGMAGNSIAAFQLLLQGKQCIF